MTIAATRYSAAPDSAAPAKTAPRLALTTIATAAVIALFIGMRLWRITDFALDGDEIFSLQLATASWRELFAKAVQDAIHPPLLYVLLKPWIALGGDSLLWLRLFPVTASVLCLIPAFGLCRDLNISPAARNLAIGIVAVHPYAMYYAQHLRMYSLLMLAALLSGWCFERYLGEASIRNLVWLGAANAFLGYTQYYGWSVVLLEFAYLLWKRRNPGPLCNFHATGGDAFRPVGVGGSEGFTWARIAAESGLDRSAHLRRTELVLGRPHGLRGVPRKSHV